MQNIGGIILKKVLGIVLAFAMLITLLPAFAANGVTSDNLIVNGDVEAAAPIELGAIGGTNARAANTGFGGSWVIRNSNRYNGNSVMTWASPSIDAASLIKTNGAGQYTFSVWVETLGVTTDAAGTLAATIGTGNQSVLGCLRTDYAYTFNGSATVKQFGTWTQISNGTTPSGWVSISYNITVTAADIIQMNTNGASCSVKFCVDTIGPSFDLYLDGFSLTKVLDNTTAAPITTATQTPSSTSSPTPTPSPTATSTISPDGNILLADFEDASLAGWTAPYGGTLAISSTIAHGGTKAMQLSNRSTNSWYSPSYNIYNKIKAKGAGSYKVNMWVRSSAAGGAGLVIRFATAGQYSFALTDTTTGAPLNLGRIPIVGTHSADTWTLFSGTFTVTEADLALASGDMNLCVDTLTADTIYIDDVSIQYVQTTSAPYIYGYNFSFTPSFTGTTCWQRIDILGTDVFQTAANANQTGKATVAIKNTGNAAFCASLDSRPASWNPISASDTITIAPGAIKTIALYGIPYGNTILLLQLYGINSSTTFTIGNNITRIDQASTLQQNSSATPNTTVTCNLLVSGDNFIPETTLSAPTPTSTPAPEYSVTYKDYDNSVLYTESVVQNGKAAEPINLARSNYKDYMATWYKEGTLTTPWDFTTDAVTADTSLFVKWKLKGDLNNSDTVTSQDALFALQVASGKRTPTSIEKRLADVTGTDGSVSATDALRILQLASGKISTFEPINMDADVSSGTSITLPSTIGNDMVLQRDVEFTLTGNCTESGTVAVIINGQHWFGASANGTFAVTVGPIPAGGPYDITIRNSTSKKVITNVLFGDVYICSGQSNMALTLGSLGDAALAAKYANTNVRYFSVGQQSSNVPLDTCMGSWVMGTSTNISPLSAVAVIYGTTLAQKYNVPIGIVISCVGGTMGATWLPAEEASLTAPIPYVDPVNYPISSEPSYYYNGMINPLKNIKVKGVVWYQGEGQPSRYDVLLTNLISGWRREFTNPNMYFVIIQLPRYDSSGNQWALSREKQATVARTVSKVAYCVNIDLGDAANIHPLDKEPVGIRAAQAAMSMIYKETGVPKAPTYKSYTVSGSNLIVTLDNVGDGLQLINSGTGFQICGADNIYYAASATISGNTIILYSPNVAAPTNARYCFSDFPAYSLFNSYNLPCEPFRTNAF